MIGALGEQYGGAASNKRFFVKFDPDTVLLPHTLLRLLRELSGLMEPGAPYLVGMAACRRSTGLVFHRVLYRYCVAL